MSIFLQKLSFRRPAGLGQAVSALTLAVLLSGCAAFEGVNVGASIPIGGIVNVGANKTVGQGQSSKPKKQETPKPSEEGSDEESEEPAQ